MRLDDADGDGEVGLGDPPHDADRRAQRRLAEVGGLRLDALGVEDVDATGHRPSDQPLALVGAGRRVQAAADGHGDAVVGDPGRLQLVQQCGEDRLAGARP